MLSFLLSICDPMYHDQINMLVKTYHNDLIIYAKHILKRAGVENYEIEAEDVVQNVYMRIVKYCRSIRFYESSPVMKAYLKKILKNEAMTFLKEQEHLESLDDKPYLTIDEGDFIEMIQAKEDYRRVVTAIYNLKDIYSYTLSYRFCDEMEVADIAKLMGVSEKAIYTRIERGLKLLLEMLNEGEEKSV